MKSITIARNNDLLRNALSIVASTHNSRRGLTMPELIDRAMRSRPQQFYLSYDTARRLLKTYYDHGHEAFLYAEKAAEVEELAAHVERAMARNRRMRLSEALTFVLHFCRPSRFYISRDSATRIIRRHFTTSIICTDPGARLYSAAE